MARPSVFSIDDKYRLVLAVISGEMSIAEAARRGKASEQSISNWKRLFLESGKQGLAENGKPGPNAREGQLLDEVEELKAALGEAHVELRVWKKSAEHRLGPTALKRNGRVLERNYQAERRQHAQARRAAFVVPPSGPNQVWQCDFTEFETRMGGTWRIGGIADYWSKLELGYHVATTQNHRDAIETVELALAETRRLYGRPLLDLVTDTSTGEIKPVALVTDNGPCFKSARFAAFVDAHPELIHIRTKRKSPGQNGVRERAFGSLKHEHLYRHEIDDGHNLGLHVERYRQLFNEIQPHHSLAGRRPLDVHLEARTTDQILKSTEPETLPLS